MPAHAFAPASAAHHAPRRSLAQGVRWSVSALCLGLAACGGGGGGSDSSSGGTVVEDTTGTCNLPNFVQEMTSRINQLRTAGADCGSEGVFAATNGVNWNIKLTAAAEGHAKDMATNNYFSHTGLNGSTLGSRVTAAGYSWSALGENIAAGQATVEEAMNAWIASPGHCANLMNPSFTEVGVACELAASSSNNYKTYWVMDLGKPN